jgi:hypothetical protein
MFQIHHQGDLILESFKWNENCFALVLQKNHDTFDLAWNYLNCDF